MFVEAICHLANKRGNLLPKVAKSEQMQPIYFLFYNDSPHPLTQRNTQAQPHTLTLTLHTHTHKKAHTHTNTDKKIEIKKITHKRVCRKTKKQQERGIQI